MTKYDINSPHIFHYLQRMLNICPFIGVEVSDAGALDWICCAALMELNYALI